MQKSYKTLAHDGEVEIVINKSRFIGRAFRCESEEQAQGILEQLRKKYWDATHNCYAYVFGDNFQISRCSDDGEPSGTAGVPILEVLRQQELTGLLVVVTRYFGGILLGAGGLVRAYSKSCAKAIENAGVVTMKQTAVYEMECDYAFWGKLENYLRGCGGRTADTRFAQSVTVTLNIPAELSESFEKECIDMSNARVAPRKTGELFMEWDE